MPRALILGGTGVIGQAAARRLLAAGWQVDLTGRDPGHLPADVAAAGGRFHPADRHDPAALAAVLGDGADLLVDCLCYTAADARSLLPLAGDASSAVMISAKAVYVDAAGNHVNSDVRPRFDGPVREDQATMAPGDGDYQTRNGYGANKVAAEHVLRDSGLPVTVIRPSKVHGPGGSRPGEWMFVKRILDRRPAVFLARRGEGIDHPTAAANLAALIETVAARPGSRVLNCADPDHPAAREIVAAIARHLDYQWREILLGETGPGGEPLDPGLGYTPWNAPDPIILDVTAAAGLGYVPAGDYAATAAAGVDWLVGAASAGGGTPPGLDQEFFAPLLDYRAEDRYLAELLV